MQKLTDSVSEAGAHSMKPKGQVSCSVSHAGQTVLLPFLNKPVSALFGSVLCVVMEQM